ncbi:hypothetical protein Z043_123269, partial [Scleropages formosus]
YLEVVRRSLAAENPECPLLVKEASNTLYQRLKDPKTYDNITADFSLCTKLQVRTEMDAAYFLETVAGNFMDVVQYNEDNRDFEGVVGTNITIKVLCGVMADASLGDPYSRYAAVAQLMLKTFSQKCLDVNYTTYLMEMRNTSWSGPASGGGRQWVYQTCTEFGFYQTTDSPNQPFSGFPLHYLGTGYDIRTTRIVFPNGSIDPWHALGITQDINKDLPAVFIKGTAHCANMYPAREQDLPQLTMARDHVYLLLQKWLTELLCQELITVPPVEWQRQETIAIDYGRNSSYIDVLVPNFLHLRMSFSCENRDVYGRMLRKAEDTSGRPVSHRFHHDFTTFSGRKSRFLFAKADWLQPLPAQRGGLGLEVGGVHALRRHGAGPVSGGFKGFKAL